MNELCVRAVELTTGYHAGAALNALARFFQNNQALTREEFSLLVSKSQNRNPASRA